MHERIIRVVNFNEYNTPLREIYLYIFFDFRAIEYIISKEKINKTFLYCI
jgi:hypothetical protein